MTLFQSVRVLLLLAGSAGTVYGQAVEADQIRAARVRSNRAILTRDLIALTGTMLADMEVTAGSGRHISSRDSVRTLFAKTFADAAFLDYVRTTDSVQVSTMLPLAAEHGHWTGRWKRPDGIQVVNGTYLAQWRRTDAGWKLRAELFVSLNCVGSRECSK